MMLLPTLRPDQKAVIQEIQSHQNIVCIFPRGTGKTTTGLTYAIEEFKNKKNGIYICNKQVICRITNEIVKYNLLSDPRILQDIQSQSTYGNRFIHREQNVLDVTGIGKMLYFNTSDFIILDELDVITDQSQLEIFKMFNNFRSSQKIIFTSLAYKSFMDKLNSQYFGPFKVVKL